MHVEGVLRAPGGLMYYEIGSFDAKAKLSELLKRVEQGEQFTITVRGRPIADLIPSHASCAAGKLAVIHELQKAPRIRGLSSHEIKNMIEEGRV